MFGSCSQRSFPRQLPLPRHTLLLRFFTEISQSSSMGHWQLCSTWTTRKQGQQHQRVTGCRLSASCRFLERLALQGITTFVSTTHKSGLVPCPTRNPSCFQRRPLYSTASDGHYYLSIESSLCSTSFLNGVKSGHNACAVFPPSCSRTGLRILSKPGPAQLPRGIDAICATRIEESPVS
jgi:hypothetical protein